MWSKIENAPKDRPILGYRDGKMAVVNWDHFNNSNITNCWVIGATTGIFTKWYPEFWMELPDAPNETDLQWRWPTYKEVKEKVDTPLELKKMALDAMLRFPGDYGNWTRDDCIRTYHEFLKALRES